MTVGWSRVVGALVESDPTARPFGEFVARHPQLLLFGPAARSGFVEPDLKPLPGMWMPAYRINRFGADWQAESARRIEPRRNAGRVSRMKRILSVAVGTAAAITIGVRSVVAITGNSSPGGSAPAFTPSDERPADFVAVSTAAHKREPGDDHGRHGVQPGDDHRAASDPADRRDHAAAEPGDDRGRAEAEPGDGRGRAEAEPGDDRGRAEAEPGDDRGRAEAEPGDDRGRAEAEPGDDRGIDEHGGAHRGRDSGSHGGGRGGAHGSDDGQGHR